ncbi:hypothetical protein BJ122_10514 [Rhodopseudomonas faecalis]|uniref:Uncharacterized protein n=1 Tax=Rhodopseudomonas faecalis TaxID=99655 RepID=A0A318TKW2_9BRAD|nr:hypothetical protein [Rhodopseudomonas faecalis]PYF03758.1 hypothetical protein BJ122_10514 [Rhodopseudomonas faecalis]
MEYVKFTVKLLGSLTILIVIGAYISLIYMGDLPAPDITSLAKQLMPSISNGGSVVAVLAIAICLLLTALAPLIFAARSGDLFTVVVSVVALVVCFALAFNSRSIMDIMLAAIIYFTSALISVVIYSTNHIADAIRNRIDTQTPRSPS